MVRAAACRLPDAVRITAAARLLSQVIKDLEERLPDQAQKILDLVQQHLITT